METGQNRLCPSILRTRRPTLLGTLRTLLVCRLAVGPTLGCVALPEAKTRVAVGARIVIGFGEILLT